MKRTEFANAENGTKLGLPEQSEKRNVNFDAGQDMGSRIELSNLAEEVEVSQ